MEPSQHLLAEHGWLSVHKSSLSRRAEIQRIVEKSAVAQEQLPDNLDGSPQPKPGLLLLTTGLSRPFRRLQQYSGLLQELHRHLPEAHKDRGDAQRAAKVMTDLAVSWTNALTCDRRPG